MRVRVKVFATLARYVPGVKAATPFDVDVADGATLADLARQLNLPGQEVKTVFVNGRAQPLSHVLKPGDEIGIFPPVGGG